MAGSTATRFPLPFIVRGVLTRRWMADRRVSFSSSEPESVTERVVVEM